MSARCRSLVVAGLTLAAVGIGMGRSPAQAQTLPAEPPVSVQPELCFTGANSNLETIPVAVTVVNRTNRDLTSKLTISSEVFGGEHPDYTIPASVPAHSSRRFFLYEANAGYYDVSAADYLRVDGFGLRDVRVVRSHYNAIASDGNKTANTHITLVSKSTGLLLPYRFAEKTRNPAPAISYYDGYVKPDFVPDSALGFSGVRTLAIGAEGKDLDAAQWKAIRQWVSGGGSLILLGNADFSNPAVADLLPVSTVPPASYHYPANLASDVLKAVFQRPVWNSALAHKGRDLHEVPNSECRQAGWLKPGAKRLDLASSGPSSLARCQVGLGTVLFVGIDPTELAIRKWGGFQMLWENLAALAQPGASAETIQVLGNARGYESGSQWRYANNPTSPMNDDPFQFKLPPVDRILYLYLGFFVLAIPVSFVVLRRLRKPNLAWVTGPVLAVVFAGALGVFAAPLYSAKMSRRTAGILILSHLDHEARFRGVTELFLPQKGSYDLAIKGGEMMDSRVYDSSIPSDTSLHLLKVDDTLHTPGYRVSSLSFRRMACTQTVDVGEGITITNARCTADGLLRATIVNRTPFTLNRAEILLPYGDEEGHFRFMLDDLAPGSHEIMLHRIPVNDDTLRPDLGPGSHVGKYASATAPILMADLPGDSFGPQCGQVVDSWNSVTLIASLPPIDRREGEH